METGRAVTQRSLPRFRVSYLIVRAAAVAVFCLLLCAVRFSSRSARAEELLRTEGEPSAVRAVELAPGSAKAHVAAGLYEEALALNPRERNAWLLQAAARETGGDLTGAAASLRRLAAIDHTYPAYWAAANFFHRTGNQDAFWPAVREAIRLAPGGRTPVFTLCWQRTDSREQIWSVVAPQVPPVQAEYIRFLLASGRMPAARDAAVRLLPQAGPREAALLLDVADASLTSTLTDLPVAMTLWNGLAERKLIPFEPIRPARPNLIVNPGFAISATGKAFDWRTASVSGVEMILSAATGLRLLIAGPTPPAIPLLTQWVPATPGRYRLGSTISGDSPRAASALEWDVATPSGRSLLTSEEDVQIPAGEPLVQVQLRCRRLAAGQSPEGWIAVESVSLSPVP